ncbi:hypothetical protein, conserved [Angomonas deanei]|uniref:Cyclic nucleotide-binding domain-containing protein n=1 Tax=Angomonas deanei TaxID=59799 RepID=A0A7G2C8U5_9TRYP|nr:hypothetical protein, conserved [Angomonas deanei]
MDGSKRSSLKSASPKKTKGDLALSSSALQSPSKGRKSSAGMPLCMSKGQRDAASAQPFSPSGRRKSLGKGANVVRAPGEVPGELDRSFQMMLNYPIMKVADTAFDVKGSGSSKASPLSHKETDSAGNASPQSSAVSSPVYKAYANDPMIQDAKNMKRAAMWQNILVTALFHETMTSQFRELRLRKVLERHLLPILMQRKQETGSIMNKSYVRESTGSKPTTGENDTVNGGYLKESDPFFQNLNNSALLQSLAEKMNRRRFVSGEIIGKPDDFSQQCMYFIISGKVEFRRDDTLFEAPIDDNLLPSKRVYLPGESFGGIFLCTAHFGGVYRALSQCIIWTLTAEDFENVFRPFADQTMRDTYKAALKEKSLEWLNIKHKMASLPQRMPIYRHLASVLPHKKYYESFEPMVLLRGDVLFEEGDAAGDVFCLLEGHILRSVRGVDGTYSSGVSQVLGLNEYTTFNRMGRLLLLGEEPHLLPGAQRCRCSVASRSALVVRIPKDAFINALLDEPSYLLQLREKLIELYKSEMKLDAQCLRFVPLFKDFSESALGNLTKEAKPIVVQRSVALCEPAQHVKEIFLLTMGDVRDTRTFGHAPTGRLNTPPPTVLSSEEENADKGRGKRDKEKKVVTRVHKALSTAPSDVEEPKLGWSFVFHDMTNNQAPVENDGSLPYALTTPEEQADLNPPLPLPPAKRFSVTLGGSWEGLLTDKWPYGWEATSTVTAWTIPSLHIRNEFNSCPKSVQNSILQGARLRQKEELDLPAVKVEKLPPMTVYQPDAKVGYVSAAPAGNNSRLSSARRSATKSRKSENLEGSMSMAEEMQSGNIYSSSMYSEGVNTSKKKSSVRVGSAKAPEKKAPAEAPRKIKKPKSEKTAKAPPPKASPPEEEAPPSLPKKKASIQHFNYSTKSAPKQEAETKEVSPHLLAVYNGEFKNDDPAVINIVRDPIAPPAKKSAKAGDSSAGQWPAASGKQRWFNEVPSYEPLPGTTQNDNLAVDVPEYKANTTYMTKRSGKNYRENLTGTVTGMDTTAKADKRKADSPIKKHSVNPRRHVQK